MLLASLLSHVTDSLEGAAEKKSLLLHKVNTILILTHFNLYYIYIYIYIYRIVLYDLQIRDINELSRQDVDAIIKMCDCQEYVTASDNIHKRSVNFFLLLAKAPKKK